MFLSSNPISISRKKSLFLFLGSISMLCVEVFVLKIFNIARDHNILLFIVPSALFCFLYLKTIKLKDNNIYIHIRKISVLLFYGHIWVLKAVEICSRLLGVNINYTPLRFLIILTVTIFIAIVVIKLSEKKPFNWLKNFY